MKLEFWRTTMVGNTEAGLGWPRKVEQYIVREIKNSNNVLNLFSGRSLIGNVRVDTKRPEATHNQNVLDFIKENNNFYDYIIADPPYKIMDSYDKENALLMCNRGDLLKWLKSHTNNILWLDWRIPRLTAAFHIKHLALIETCPWEHIRVFTHLTKKRVGDFG